jgi:hypothetical protein
LAKPQTHVERLRKAGVLSDNPRHLTKEHEEAINSLSDDEVEALVRVKKKVGVLHKPGHAPGRCWIF